MAGEVDPGMAAEDARKGLTGRMAVLGGSADYPVARLLRQCGLQVADAEPPPKQISDQLADQFGFGAASVRAGPLGHVALIRQAVDQAVTGTLPANPFWKQRDGTLVDAMRAAVEPFGLPDRDAAVTYRAAHLAALRGLLAETAILVLPLATMRGLVDPADGTVYPEPPNGVLAPKSLKLKQTKAKPGDLEDSFAALHASLQGVAPGIQIWLLVWPAGQDLASCETEAMLRALAAGWQARFANVRADPVLDHILHRMTELNPEETIAQQLGALVAGLFMGGRLGDLSGAVPSTAGELPVKSPVAISQSRAERKERRKQRREGRQKTRDPAVICEDELLEAFS